MEELISTFIDSSLNVKIIFIGFNKLSNVHSDANEALVLRLSRIRSIN